MDARLYVVPGSHPSMAARLMLESKGIAYKRRDLIPIMSKGILRMAGFPGITVPALKLDGRKIQGTTAIAHELDRVRPDPPLYPSDAALLAEVEAAEAYGDEDLQNLARQTLWYCLKQDKGPLRSFSEGARLGVPVGVAVKTAGPIIAIAARSNDATGDNVRANLAALPEVLRRINGWIETGVLGGEEPNAADLMIAPSLRLLMSLDDLRPAIESTPAGEMALRFVPEFPGRIPPLLPAAWLEPLDTLSAAKSG